MNYIKDKKTNQKILYIEPNELKNEVIDPIGETAIGKQEEPGKQIYLEDQNIKLTVQPLGTYKKSGYKLLGYVKSEEGYIALKKKKFPWLLLLLLLLLTGGIGLGWKMLSDKPDTGIDPNAYAYESQLKRPENIDSSKILIPGYGDFKMKAGSDTIETVLFNPEDNPCHFQFTLVDAETQEVLYESKLVPPGQGVGPIKLTKTFNEKGSYPAVLKFKTVDFEDTDINYNGSEINLNIVVE